MLSVEIQRKAGTARRKLNMTQPNPDVAEAQKQIGQVLEKLEGETGGEVKGIGLEEVVDTDPHTGRPVIKKAVDIKLLERPAKRWAR